MLDFYVKFHSSKKNMLEHVLIHHGNASVVLIPVDLL